MTNDVRQVVERTERGGALAQRIYDIIARDDFNPDHATDIRQAIEEALVQPSEVERLRRVVEACGLDPDMPIPPAPIQVQKERAEKAEAALKREESSHAGTMDSRDRAQEMADELAERVVALTVGGEVEDVIGEHTSANCPWRRAIELADEHLEAQPAPSGWQQRIAAIAKDAAERVAKNAGVAPQLCYAPILGALEDAISGQNAKDAHPLLPQCALETAFREGYDFGQADAGFDEVDADGAWSKSSTRQHAKDALSEWQARVHEWMLACFGEAIASDRLERCDRFCEEALELLQSFGYPRESASSHSSTTSMVAIPASRRRKSAASW